MGMQWLLAKAPGFQALSDADCGAIFISPSYGACSRRRSWATSRVLICVDTALQTDQPVEDLDNRVMLEVVEQAARTGQSILKDMFA
jgi:hypothetical protein